MQCSDVDTNGNKSLHLSKAQEQVCGQILVNIFADITLNYNKYSNVGTLDLPIASVQQFVASTSGVYNV